MARKAGDVLTGTELLDVVATLEPVNGPALTLRKLKYLEAHLAPRAVGVTNQARLYRSADVALVRLFLRLTGRGQVTAWQARAVLALRNTELRRGLDAAEPSVLVVDW